MSGGLFLGLALATEQLRASVVDESLEVIAQVAVDFDLDLPQYLTNGGLLSSPPNCTPADMWIHGLDLLIERLSRTLDISRIKAIGGSAQHALVFCKHTIFPQLNPRTSLQAQLPAHLLLAQTNLYTDYDTSSYTHSLALQTLLGGQRTMAARVGVTANACPTMFAGQLLRIRANHLVDCWSRTGKVLSASSFLASMIVGRWVGMGKAEAATSGMYNPKLGQWDEHVLDAVAGGRDDARKLRAWLGAVDDVPRGKIGHINRYWVERYHFEPSTIVTPFIPDYLSSYLSLTPNTSDCAIVFDSSNNDVLLSSASQSPVVNPRRILIPHPMHPHPMPPVWLSIWITPCATASRNRALMQYAKTWSAFSRLVEVVPPGGSIGLDDKLFSFWSVPSVPSAPISNSNGVHINVGTVAVWRFEQGHQVTEFRDLRANPRVLLESQIFSLKIRSRPFLSPRPNSSQPHVKRVLCVGEAALMIPALSEILASIFIAEIYTPTPTANSVLSPKSISSTTNAVVGPMILSDTERYRAATGSAFAARFIWALNTSGNNNEVRYEDDTRKKLNDRRKTSRSTSTGSVHPIGHAPALSVLVEEPEEIPMPYINLNDDDNSPLSSGMDRHEHLLSLFASDRIRTGSGSGSSSPLGRSSSKRWEEVRSPAPEEVELMTTLGLARSAVPDQDVCDAYGSLIPEVIRLCDVVRRAGG